MRHLTRATERLVLVATTTELLRAEIVSHAQLAELLHAHVPDGWPPGEYDSNAQAFFLEHLLEGGNNSVGWYGWYALTNEPSKQRPTLIAAGGFLGPPDDTSTVELGYSVHDRWQKQGFATELVMELVEFAFEHPSVLRIVAHTTTDNPASCEVLKKCGFSRTCAPLNPPTVEFELIRTPDNRSSVAAKCGYSNE